MCAFLWSVALCYHRKNENNEEWLDNYLRNAGYNYDGIGFVSGFMGCFVKLFGVWKL